MRGKSSISLGYKALDRKIHRGIRFLCETRCGVSFLAQMQIFDTFGCLELVSHMGHLEKERNLRLFYVLLCTINVRKNLLMFSSYTLSLRKLGIVGGGCGTRLAFMHPPLWSFRDILSLVVIRQVAW